MKVFMINFLDSHIDIIHRSSPQWVYDYLQPFLLVIFAFIMFVLLIGICIFIYKEIRYD